VSGENFIPLSGVRSLFHPSAFVYVFSNNAVLVKSKPQSLNRKDLSSIPFFPAPVLILPEIGLNRNNAFEAAGIYWLHTHEKFHQRGRGRRRFVRKGSKLNNSYISLAALLLFSPPAIRQKQERLARKM